MSGGGAAAMAPPPAVDLDDDDDARADDHRAPAFVDPDDGKSWYALHISTGFEKKAQEMLQERIKQEGMTDAIGEVLLPTGTTVEIKRGKKKEAEEKLFPSYLFVRMKMTPKSWHLVRNTKFINGFIGGSSEEPRPLTADEMNIIRDQMSSSAPAARAKFLVGERIRIKSGPFNDFDGMIETVHSDRERLTVSVTVFDRSTPVELDFDQAEKL